MRDYKLYLKDILESLEKIEEYTLDVDEEKFIVDQKLQDAVIRRIEIIGEASHKIPRSIKNVNKEIPWDEIGNFRDFIVHTYFGASIHRIWNMIKEDFPKLKKKFLEVKLL